MHPLVRQVAVVVLAGCAPEGPASDPPGRDVEPTESDAPVTVESDAPVAVDSDPPASESDAPDPPPAPPPVNWRGPDVTSPAFAQVMAESGHCATLLRRNDRLEVMLVGLDTGTRHLLASGIPFDLRPRPKRRVLSFAMHDGWLWIADQEVVRVDPFTGVVERFVADRDAVGLEFRGGDLLVLTPFDRVDVYDDLLALQAFDASRAWSFDARPLQHSVLGDERVWEFYEPLGWIAHQGETGPSVRLDLPDYGKGVAGFSAAGGRLHLLDEAARGTGRQRLHVYDVATGERLALFDLGLVVFDGLACVYR